MAKPTTKSKAQKPEISVVLPTFNRGDILIDTIKDVLSQSFENLELLVVDQSVDIPPEMTRELATIKDKRLRYFFIDPPSLTAARNFALHKANSDIVLYIDDDVKLHKDLVKNHLKAFREHPDASAIAGRVMQKGFPIQKDVLRFDELAVSRGVFTATEGSYTNAFPGGNCALKVDDALSVGGFDTRFYQNFFREESDMSMKMTHHGMKIYYEPTAELLHLAAPRGGTRTAAYTDIRNTKSFYRNELFFTIRAADKKFAALRYKFDEYCKIEGSISKRRALYFFLGLGAALWRSVFGRQLVQRERV